MGEREKRKGLFGGGWRSGALILGALAGILLILAGGSGLGQKEQSTQTQQAPKDEMQAYREAVEARIVALCAGVKGVSRVRVGVSFEGDVSYVYATDSDTRQAEGQTQSELQYVTVGSGASEKTVLLTRSYPKISGIGVVCVGGGNGEVRRELIALLSTAFDVGSNKIYIAEANP